MTSFDPFHRVVANMMSRFGTVAILVVPGEGVYDMDKSEYVTTNTEYAVRAMFFDLTLQRNGLKMGADNLIQEGDKQVFVQPLNQSTPGLSLPQLQPNKDKIKIGDKVYKIMSSKQLNTTMMNPVLIELYVRE